MKIEKRDFRLSGVEGRGNFHGIHVFLENLPAFRAEEWFANPEYHPEYYGVISESKIPSLCGMSDCLCGCEIRREEISESLREKLTSLGVYVPGNGVLISVS